MKIARYWAKGKAEGRTASGKMIPLQVWGWSESSLDEARQKAREAVERAARRLEARQPLPHSYGYADRPAREEIVREITGADGGVVATITRNSYGSLVLNTARLMFIDVDVPAETFPQRFVRLVSGWLGRETATPEVRIQKQIEKAAAEYSRHTVRLYRTAAGFRCAIADQPLTAGRAESHRLLEAFGADPLYVKICKAQECYRARLTPKFWRCEARRPPHRFPWQTARAEQEYRRWENEYARQCQPFAVCRFITQFGNRTDAELQTVLDLHDHYVRAKSDLALA
jgi:hypothetical protein